MNDEQIVQALVNGLSAYTHVGNQTETFKLLEPRAKDALASVRAAGFEFYRPKDSFARYMGDWDEWLPIYDQLPVVTRAALAHFHGRHDEPTMYCPLCGFDPDGEANP